MRKTKVKKRDIHRSMRRKASKISTEDWTRSKDNICRICGNEIKGTRTVYLGEPYHLKCMYPGPYP